jgi:hypothetical protein
MGESPATGWTLGVRACARASVVGIQGVQMRMKRPYVATLDHVRIRWEGEYAIIEYLEPGVSTTHLKIGPHVRHMTLGEILALHNSVLRSQQEAAQSYHHVAVEVPEGRPQIRYHAGATQWVPRGDVLRCLISDDADGEIAVHIDDRELSAQDFCRMLKTFAGWGMRIVFAPEDETGSEPTIEVREPDDRADAEPVH